MDKGRSDARVRKFVGCTLALAKGNEPVQDLLVAEGMRALLRKSLVEFKTITFNGEFTELRDWIRGDRGGAKSATKSRESPNERRAAELRLAEDEREKAARAPVESRGVGLKPPTQAPDDVHQAGARATATRGRGGDAHSDERFERRAVRRAVHPRPRGGGALSRGDSLSKPPGFEARLVGRTRERGEQARRSSGRVRRQVHPEARRLRGLVVRRVRGARVGRRDGREAASRGDGGARRDVRRVTRRRRRDCHARRHRRDRASRGRVTRGRLVRARGARADPRARLRGRHRTTGQG